MIWATTTKALGFDSTQTPVTAAQLSRGKAEAQLLFEITLLMQDLGRFAADVLPQVAADVFLLDDGHLAGSVPLIELLRADGARQISELVEHSNASVRVDDDFPEVARRMADFNLTVVAVLEDDDRVIGVITVDDVLEAMLPDAWRRRAEADGD